MKKSVASLFTCTLFVLLSGCGNESGQPSKAPKQASQSSRVIHSTSSSYKNSDKRAQSKNSNSKENDTDNSNAATSSSASSIAEKKQALWRASKNQELSTFMTSWSQSMKQVFVGTYDGSKPDHLGYVFPDAITDPTEGEHFMLNNAPVTFTWSETGKQISANQVVAAATGHKDSAYQSEEEKAADDWPITYLFAVLNGRPVVLYSKTTNGNAMYFAPTQNAALQKGFAQIYNHQ